MASSSTYTDIEQRTYYSGLLQRPFKENWSAGYHTLSIKQKERVQMAKEYLVIYEGYDSKSLNEIVTGDETGIQLDMPIRKKEAKVWLGKGEVSPALTMSDVRFS